MSGLKHPSIAFLGQKSSAYFLAGQDNPSALAASNAKLRQTDLVSELLGTLAFGWASTHLGMSTALAVLTSITFLGLPLQLFFLRQVKLMQAPTYF